MFYLSRVFVEFLAPFPFSIFLLLLAFVLLLLRRAKLGTILLAFALFLQVFTGYGFWVRHYLAEIEATYPALTDNFLQEIQQKRISHIVVLGSGHVSDDRLPANSQIGDTSLFRLVEGIRLALLFPDSQLILTGGIGYDPVPNAEVVNLVAQSLGFPRDRIFVENRPRDTLQEAELLVSVLDEHQFLLVTSALHMPRAVKIFQNEGLHPIAAPTDYIIKKDIARNAGELFPSASNINLAKNLLYEWLATIFAGLKQILN